MSEVNIELIMSGASLAATGYFWLLKARKDLPKLEFYQLSDFRVVARRIPDQKDMKRLCVQQLDTGGVLAVNHTQVLLGCAWTVMLTFK